MSRSPFKFNRTLILYYLAVIILFILSALLHNRSKGRGELNKKIRGKEKTLKPKLCTVPIYFQNMFISVLGLDQGTLSVLRLFSTYNQYAQSFGMLESASPGIHIT